jgi:hypothetical protein
MKFRASQIQRIVEDSISEYDFERDCGYAPDFEFVLDGLVLPPTSNRYFKSQGVGFRWLWSVWDSGSSNSYQVVYDPREKMFGIAFRPEGKRYGRLVDLASYGLIEAISSM